MSDFDIDIMILKFLCGEINQLQRRRFIFRKGSIALEL